MKNLYHILIAAALMSVSGCGEKTPEAASEAKTVEAAEKAPEAEGKVEVSLEAQREGGIRTETLRRSSVPETFQAMGRVMQDAQKPHHIMAGGTGRLETVSCTLGQAVNPGAVMAVVRGAAGEEIKATTPHKGIVTAVHASEGDLVNDMSFLFTLTEVDPLWGVLDIPERSLELIKPGQKVDIKTAAYPRENFKGAVALVSPEIDQVSRMVKARVSIENPAGLLKFGMFLDAAVRTGAHFQGVAVPAAAVQNGAAGPFVFVKTGKTAFEPRAVELGRERDGQLEITKGLKAGESVVVENAYLLKSEMMKSQMGED